MDSHDKAVIDAAIALIESQDGRTIVLGPDYVTDVPNQLLADLSTAVTARRVARGEPHHRRDTQPWAPPSTETAPPTKPSYWK